MRPRRILVTCGSAHGSTTEIGAWIGDALRGSGFEVEVRDPDTISSVKAYDAVVLGGAVYAGRWHKNARRFARRHRTDLATRPVWLFSSGPLDHSADEGVVPPPPGVARIMRRLGARGHATFGGSLANNHGHIAHAIAAKLEQPDFRDPTQVRAWAHEIADQIAEDHLPATSG
jgi:menaquinone-dependent protoporphyrinogen oxidase